MNSYIDALGFEHQSTYDEAIQKYIKLNNLNIVPDVPLVKGVDYKCDTKKHIYGLIYLVIDLKRPEKAYVGQTAYNSDWSMLKTRFYQHEKNKWAQTHSVFDKAYSKRPETFMVVVIAVVTNESPDPEAELDKLEKFFILKYNTFYDLNENGYNFTEGGRNGRKSKITAKKVGKPNNAVISVDPETGEQFFFDAKSTGAKYYGGSKTSVANAFRDIKNFYNFGEHQFVYACGYYWREATEEEKNVGYENGEYIGIDEEIEICVLVNEDGEIIERAMSFSKLGKKLNVSRGVIDRGIANGGKLRGKFRGMTLEVMTIEEVDVFFPVGLTI